MLLIGCIIVLLVSIVIFTSAVESYRNAGQALSGIINARLLAYVIVPLCFSLLGVVASVGLFGLREWARKIVMFLSIVPVTTCALLVLLRPEAIFPSDTGLQYAILTVGSLGIVMYEYMLVILIPVSVWWLVLFTRKNVRSQFQ